MFETAQLRIHFKKDLDFAAAVDAAREKEKGGAPRRLGLGLPGLGTSAEESKWANLDKWAKEKDELGARVVYMEWRGGVHILPQTGRLVSWGFLEGR